MPTPNPATFGNLMAFGTSAVSQLLEAKREMSRKYLSSQAGPLAGAFVVRGRD